MAPAGQAACNWCDSWAVFALDRSGAPSGGIHSPKSNGAVGIDQRPTGECGRDGRRHRHHLVVRKATLCKSSKRHPVHRDGTGCGGSEAGLGAPGKPTIISLKLWAQTRFAGLHAQGPIGYGTISARPDSGSSFLRSFSGFSVSTISQVGRTQASTRWPPWAVPSRLATTTCECTCGRPSASATSPIRETSSTCSFKVTEGRYCFASQSNQPSFTEENAPIAL